MISNMLDALESTAARNPEKIAFFDDREGMTFARLMRIARRVGSCLASVAKQRTPVALMLDARSLRNIPALYGVLYAGCAYAPLDITMPPERLTLLLKRLSPSAIIADEKGMRALQSLENVSVPVLPYGDAAVSAEDDAALSAIRANASVYDPMSILFTSGSTGIPKGSVQSHFSYIHWTEATIATYGFDENTVFGNQSPFFYANSIIDIFPPVALGASVYLLPAGVLTFPKKLVECLNARHVTELTMTPSSFVSVALAGVITSGCLPELRWGIMSGEPMPWASLSAWMQATPMADWWHFYGSTEMFSVAVGRVDKQHREGDRLPVGKPFKLAHIVFVDENGREAAPGEPGEMLVSSPWIAQGYHRDESRSAAAWVTDPLGCGWYERFYRSGDIGYLRQDGQLMVLGRRDSQIKHHGYRMELGEVEAALHAVSGWEDGCVMFQKESGRIWCFFTGALTEKELTRALKAKLAGYMLPDMFVHMEQMPHTASMKLDRAALMAMMA